MPSLSRRFAEWVTGFRSDPFRVARWKLTGVYTLLLAFVVITLTLALYEVHSSEIQEIDRKPADATPVVDAPEPTLESYLERLVRSIVLVDLAAIVASSVLSYFVAGRTLRPIRSAHQQQTQFFASAAHDLRTPLAVLRTQMEVSLADPRLSLKEARAVLESALEEVDRMTRLSTDLLALSGRDRQVRQRDWIDLADLVQSVVLRLGATAQEKSLTWPEVEAAPLLVEAYPQAVERALVNVLANAIRYTPAGGRVDVAVKDTGSHAVVTVSDTGIGIDRADLPRVFEPFYRSEAARLVSAEGAGLGLSIVRQIVQDHGGFLKITSQPGEGTVVALSFPKR